MDETVVKRIKSPDALTKGSNLDDDGDKDKDKTRMLMMMRMVMMVRRRIVVTFHPSQKLKTAACEEGQGLCTVLLTMVRYSDHILYRQFPIHQVTTPGVLTASCGYPAHVTFRHSQSGSGRGQVLVIGVDTMFCAC